MLKPISVILLSLFAHSLIAQNPVVYRRYNPSESATAERPATYSTPVTTQESRRSAALSKVHGKSVAPATYSTTRGGDELSPVTYSTTADTQDPNPVDEPVTTVTVNGLDVQRQVRKGSGQVGNELFTPVTELYYVQFAVYCKDTPVDKAPPIDGLYLLWHPGSTCPGGAQGASYIVKGYTSPEEARLAVNTFKASKIECWYNPALTGAEVEIIGVR